MSLWIPRWYNIVPLTKAVWNQINPEKLELVMDLDSYSDSEWLSMSTDGWILLHNELCEKPGPTYGNMYFHKAFFDLCGSPHSILCAPVFIKEIDGKLHFLCHYLTDKEGKILEKTFDFEPEDSPIQSSAHPVRNEAFVEKVLQLGKGFKIRDKPTYQFEHVLELASGLVFTKERNGKMRVYVSKTQYPNPRNNNFPIELSVQEECADADVIIYKFGEFPHHFYDKDYKLLRWSIQEQFDVLAPSSYDESLVNIVWQRREDLLPENW